MLTIEEIESLCAAAEVTIVTRPPTKADDPYIVFILYGDIDHATGIGLTRVEALRDAWDKYDNNRRN